MRRSPTEAQMRAWYGASGYVPPVSDVLMRRRRILKDAIDLMGVEQLDRMVGLASALLRDDLARLLPDDEETPI